MREPTVAIATTGFSRLGTCQARVVLAVLLTVTVGLVAVTLSPLSKGFAGVKRKGPSDAVLYEREIERIRGGETYYEAATAELTKWGYPTASVFNWRTPLPMSLIGALPDPALGKAVLVLLAAVTLLLAFEWLAREAGVVQAVVGTLALTGALMFCVLANKFVMPVLWAGTLIGLSLCAYGLNRRLLAVVAGLAALFFRDLAGPYCVLALILAIKERRRDEDWWPTASSSAAMPCRLPSISPSTAMPTPKVGCKWAGPRLSSPRRK